ncbi:RsmB/NOP family class I SAM-dependent RNA methyltransferase [Shimia biformata]|uniref:RsmB/NOP family class I SAM-dependent RNA methyltransferase n=1 Tax=Shimia biformata TaxID=1294299 RepID=UPI00194E799F|nr:RsmB/NOP family class I SAM-dependent RNA methyltransferase [Shimia biformata]
MSQSGIPARRAAAYLLDQVLGEARLLSELIGGGALNRLERDDRARAQRLATETLRGLGRADALLSNYVERIPPLPVQNILRLAVIELCAGGAAHGVVNDAVTLVAKTRQHASMKGMVNAVLRRVAKDGPTMWDTMPVPALPDWLREPLVAGYGDKVVAAMEVAHFAGAPLDLTAKGDAAALAAEVGGTLLPTGSVRLVEAGRVSGLPEYNAGTWWVQDAAAALPAKVLAPQAGERVLDLCAAPGGKTMQIAATGATVTAVDDAKSRMARLEENLTRTKLSAELVTMDMRKLTGEWDAILLDAPCSATGTIRRHPDLPFAKDGSDFMALINLQARMLDHALTLLKPGGRLVFCTCSLLPDEGECQIDEVLKRHPDLTVDRDALALPGVDMGWITEEGGLRLRPDYWADKGGMDGFYMAMLRKPA